MAEIAFTGPGSLGFTRGQAVAGPRQVEGHGGDRAAEGHHDDAVGQVHRLLDAVRDEEDGLAVGGPDGEEFVLEVVPRGLVHGGERLVH